MSNGCIYFGPKMTEMQTEYFQDINEDYIHLEKLETRKGDIICFDSYIAHASYKNLSDKERINSFFYLHSLL